MTGNKRIELHQWRGHWYATWRSKRSWWWSSSAANRHTQRASNEEDAHRQAKEAIDDVTHQSVS